MIIENLNISFNNITFPVYIMTKSVGDNCNLNCTYCQSKNKYIGESMSLETLEKFTKLYIEAQIHSSVNFFWIGGEPLLLGIDYYKKALEFQEKYGKGKKINNTIQTNGLLINKDWLNFFKENDFTVITTIDGPQFCHDHYRIDQSGKGTFNEVMDSFELIRNSEIKYSVKTTINDYNSKFPLEMYHFFKENKILNLNFQPHVSSIRGRVTEWSVSPLSYGNFLCAIFDEWVRRDVGKVNISIFDNTLKVFCRKETQNCVYSQTCGHIAMADVEGNIYTCNRFDADDFQLGNIRNNTITRMMYGRKQLKFGQQKRSNLTLQCKKCQFLKFCNGGCPKDRIGCSTNGEKKHNFLCAGYQKFYNHVSPAMTYMAGEIAEGGNISRVMTFFDDI